MRIVIRYGPKTLAGAWSAGIEPERARETFEAELRRTLLEAWGAVASAFGREGSVDVSFEQVEGLRATLVASYPPDPGKEAGAKACFAEVLRWLSAYRFTHEEAETWLRNRETSGSNLAAEPLCYASVDARETGMGWRFEAGPTGRLRLVEDAVALRGSDEAAPTVP